MSIDVATPPENGLLLNVGCGHDVRAGWTNLDIAALPGVDVVHDLDTLPLPFADSSVSQIECMDIVEHVVDMIALLREFHRVLRPGGLLHIQSPHFTSHTAYVDPTHRRSFSISTFDFFAKQQPGVYGDDRSYYFDFQFAAVVRRRIGFRQSSYQPWNRVVEKLVNRSPRLQNLYEETALSRLAPALHVDVVLSK